MATTRDAMLATAERHSSSHEFALDARLVQRVLGGDRDAYAQLVNRHQAGLYRCARGMGCDHDSACDVVQDALVRAYEELHRCRQPERFRAWLYRILRNRCLDLHKSAHARQVPLTDDIAQNHASATLQPELRTAIECALKNLPDGLREAFLLKHVEEWSYEEMADAMDVSVSALKMRVHRARDLLRQTLEPMIS